MVKLAVAAKVNAARNINMCFNKEKWFVPCNEMNGVMIGIMLLMQNVESNPGSTSGVSPVCNLSVRTYNCFSLGKIVKF